MFGTWQPCMATDVSMQSASASPVIKQSVPSDQLASFSSTSNQQKDILFKSSSWKQPTAKASFARTSHFKRYYLPSFQLLSFKTIKLGQTQLSRVMKMTAYIITLRDLFFLEIAYWHILCHVGDYHLERMYIEQLVVCAASVFPYNIASHAPPWQAWLSKPEQTFHSTELKHCGSWKHAKNLPFFSSNKIAPSLWQL